MNPRNLIIKKGATGDVVRTTVLLHILEGDVTWITDPYNKEVLPQRHPCLTRILGMDEMETVRMEEFDTVISLDDDITCAALASSFKTRELMGAYLKDAVVRYTGHFRDWFDMSLVSEFGKMKADERKLRNRDTYQSMLLRGFNVPFTDEHTCLVNESIRPAAVKGRVGVEGRAGSRWPTKAWNGYHKLAGLLTNEGYDVYFFEQRDSLLSYMKDIAACEYVLTGDTLAMHLSLAMRIPTVAIFTCTSPWEIHGYGIMEKVISPGLESAFYKNEFVAEAVESITVQDVLNAFKKMV